jgi:outer membrane protein insertion porin family
VIFPAPFLADVQSVRTSAFIDAGNVYSTYDDNFDVGELRYSAGVALEWVSPLGALTFSLAQPLNAQDDDQTQQFQFSLGATF